jgi:microcystin-dependent protein
LWSGAANAIPSGWYLCNGSNGTPNLSGKFVVGYSASDSDYDVGDTGGSKTITLSTSQLPAHTHGDGSYATNTATLTGTIRKISESFNSFGGTASGVFSKVTGQNAGGTPGSPDNNDTGGINFNGNHSHNVSGTSGSTGSGSSIENRPPYYALCYIMKA